MRITAATIVADQDAEFPSVSQPVLERTIGRICCFAGQRVLTIPKNKQIWIVLFDIEDNGNLQDWDWILGSRYFADHFAEIRPSMVVNLDIGWRF